MNFLAHLYLSHENEDWMIGNMVADFINNKDLQELSQGIREGVLIHRKIDSFTDSHDAVSQSTKRLHPVFHKYSPVVVDIYYDYFLTKNWKKYSTEPLDEFSAKIYRTLISRLEDMPEAARVRIKSMVAHEFLQSYATKDGIQEVFDRFQKRVKFPVSFDQASSVMLIYEEQFDAEFNLFFPEIIKYIK